MRLYASDGYSRWGRRLVETAGRRGWDARLITAAGEIKGPGYGFIRLHPAPGYLHRDRRLAREMARHLTLVQDTAQVAAYENKREQARRWSGWMPETWILESEAEAIEFAGRAIFPLVSKADVGASSKNVRLIEDRKNLLAHIQQAFGPGLTTHLYGNVKSRQRGYLLLQRFIPHRITYRVNAIGRQRAVFFRACYPDRPMAQTGNVEPAFSESDCPAGLLDFAQSFFQEAATRWCALDILWDEKAASWRLLETSLAWPHPSPGRCNDGRFFPGGKRWEQMWDVLLDEIEVGAFEP